MATPTMRKAVAPPETFSQPATNMFANALPGAPNSPAMTAAPLPGAAPSLPMPTGAEVRAAQPPTALPPAPPTASAPRATTTNPAINGIDPVRITPTDISGFQPFADASFNQAASRLNPQFDQAEAQFRQRMVNQGLPEGSQAFDDAFGNFSRAKNDAFSSAQNNAFAQGLAAQGQSFNQGAQQTQLAQAMAQFNEQKRLQELGLDLQNRQLSQQGSQFDATMGLNRDQFNEGQRQFNENLGFNRDQFDTSTLMGLTDQDMRAFQLNQNSQLQNSQLAQALLGLIPGMNPTNIDTFTPTQLQLGAINQNNQNATAMQNGLNSAIGSLGSAFIMSSRALKDPQGALDAEAALQAVRGLPVEYWSYKGDVTPHVGPYAEDFNRALGLPPAPTIQIVDALGSLFGSVQALANRLDALTE